MTWYDLQFTKMFIMVEPTLNNENPTQEYIGTTTYNLYTTKHDHKPTNY